ncbi:unnamed protein product, partial [Amoebophrya sp. A120]
GEVDLKPCEDDEMDVVREAEGTTLPSGRLLQHLDDEDMEIELDFWQGAEMDGLSTRLPTKSTQKSGTGSSSSQHQNRSTQSGSSGGEDDNMSGGDDDDNDRDGVHEKKNNNSQDDGASTNASAAFSSASKEENNSKNAEQVEKQKQGHLSLSEAMMRRNVDAVWRGLMETSGIRRLRRGR